MMYLKMLPANIDWNDTFNGLLEQFIQKNSSAWYMSPLLEYARKCESVTEYGTFQGQTALLWLHANVKQITCYDIDFSECHKERLKEFAKVNKQNIMFIPADPFDYGVEETDMLFCDTKHTYERVHDELYFSHDTVRKYIAIHDTNYPAPHKRTLEFTRFPDELVKDAVKEFLRDHKEWTLDKEINDNSGLMIIKRKDVI